MGICSSDLFENELPRASMGVRDGTSSIVTRAWFLHFVISNDNLCRIRRSEQVIIARKHTISALVLPTQQGVTRQMDKSYVTISWKIILIVYQMDNGRLSVWRYSDVIIIKQRVT